MKTRQIIEGLTLSIISLGSIVEGVRLVISRDPRLVSDILGPGPYIICLGVVLLVATAIYILRHNGKEYPQHVSAHSGRRWRKVFNGKQVPAIMALAMYLILIQISGYLISTTLFYVVAFRLFGVKSWVVSTVTAVVVAVVCNVVFIYYAAMVFPRGLVWR